MTAALTAVAFAYESYFGTELPADVEVWLSPLLGFLAAYLVPPAPTEGVG